MSQDTATSTATETPNGFATTPDEIISRLDSWVTSRQTCWVILPTPSGVCVEVHGRLSTQPSDRSLYSLHSDDVVTSTVTFPIRAVESVGTSCIFLKYNA